MPATALTRAEPGGTRSSRASGAQKVWQYLRQTYLSNRVFGSYRAILDAACQAWNRLIASPETIQSIAYREWATIDQSP